jgi:toluene monooxygenase system ferredoxin subunit
MAGWTFAGTLDELWQGEMLSVSVQAVDVLLCNVDGQVLAYEDRCPHLGGALSKGVLDGRVLRCAAHEWEFNACTGRGVNPSAACLRRYAVRLDGDAILVDLEGPDA